MFKCFDVLSYNFFPSLLTLISSVFPNHPFFILEKDRKNNKVVKYGRNIISLFYYYYFFQIT